MTPFEARWETVEPGGGFRRVDEEHPLDIYIGVDVSGERVLLLVTDQDVEIPPQTHAIHVLSRTRQDGRWALMFKLVSPELGRVFSHLCEDLVEFGRNLPKDSTPGKTMIGRFVRWQRLLERSGTGLLDEPAIRGLLGELLFLSSFALPVYGAVPALEGWVGPFDAEQDFRYPDCTYEIKTVSPAATQVKISSAEQLEDPGSPFQLVLVPISTAERSSETTVTLPALISSLRERFDGDQLACSLFEERLVSAGYLDDDGYRILVYRAGTFRHFIVGEGFPRIVRSQLPAGIGRVRYELDLSACSGFEEKNGEV